MASFSKLIEGKTPIINQIIAHAKVSDDIFILPEKPLNKNYNKNMTRNLKALYFSMSRSDKKDLFLGDLYEMILPHYEIENYFEFFDFVEFYKIMLKIRKIKEKHVRYKYKNKSKFGKNRN